MFRNIRRFASTLANRHRIMAPEGSHIHPKFAENMTEYRGQKLKSVVAATTCETFSLDKVASVLQSKGIAYNAVVPGETLSFKYAGADTFLMKFGTIVSWNIPESRLVSELVPLFDGCAQEVYKVQTEDIDYVSIGEEEPSHIETEVICLNQREKILDKLAFSYGISRSTRLAVLEDAVEAHTALTKSTIEKLSRGEKVDVRPKQVSKNAGRLLLLRAKLNLYSELIETPDVYWTEPELETLYRQASKALDIDPRITILNRKLDYLSDESSALVDMMVHRNESYLEWIIIYLIVIEVCYETHHFIERWREEKD